MITMKGSSTLTTEDEETTEETEEEAEATQAEAKVANTVKDSEDNHRTKEVGTEANEDDNNVAVFKGFTILTI